MSVCDACGHQFKAGQQYRTDDDGFTGCMPCFPVSNAPADSDRFMEGPCWIKVNPDEDFSA